MLIIWESLRPQGSEGRTIALLEKTLSSLRLWHPPPPPNCWEQIWTANNAMLSEGRYIGNRCSNSAWVHLWWITSWLTSPLEALPPNGCSVGIESQLRNEGQQPSELGTVKGQPLASPSSRQRPSGEASLGHGEGEGERCLQACWLQAPWLRPGLSASWMVSRLVSRLHSGDLRECKAWLRLWGPTQTRNSGGQETSRVSERGVETLLLIDWKLDPMHFLPFASWPKKPSRSPQPLSAALWLLNTHKAPNKPWGQPFNSLSEWRGEVSYARGQEGHGKKECVLSGLFLFWKAGEW